MEEDIFKVGYSTYLQKPKSKKKNWTSKIRKKINKHRIISSIIALTIMCLVLNFCLIYNFIRVLEQL